jgi:hypothetical protein
LLSWLAHFIERHLFLHRTSLAVWKHFPPRLAGFLRKLLTTPWTVGAVAVIINEEVNPPEVLLVQHSYRTRGAWGLPVPYVPKEPGPYRLDFYYRCLPKQGFGSLREGLRTGIIKPRSPELRQILLVPVSRLKEYDLYSSDARILFPLLT